MKNLLQKDDSLKLKAIITLSLILLVVVFFWGRSTKECDNTEFNELRTETDSLHIKLMEKEWVIHESKNRELMLHLKVDDLIKQISEKPTTNVITKLTNDYRGVSVQSIADSLQSEWPWPDSSRFIR